KGKFVREKLIEVEFHHHVDSMPELTELTLDHEDGNKKRLRFQNQNKGIGEVIGKLATLYPVKDISVREPSVESIIRSIYEKRALLPEQSGNDEPHRAVSIDGREGKK
ncbi:MAG: hypothetical protein ACE5EN_02225, partial [Nitrospinota bacterium]